MLPRSPHSRARATARPYQVFAPAWSPRIFDACAIVAMTRAMAVDYAPDGIRVNSLSPGSVDTPMLRRSAREAGDEDTVIAQWGANHPLGRVGTPQEVADAILFLASPLSGFVTGTELRVDGGLLAAVAVAAPETR